MINRSNTYGLLGNKLMKHSRKHAADSTFLKGVADQSTVDEPAFFQKSLICLCTIKN